MPTQTTNLQLPVPLGNEFNNRAAMVNLINEIDKKAASKQDVVDVSKEVSRVSTDLTTHLADNEKHVKKDGTLQVGLNAEMVGGKKIGDLEEGKCKHLQSITLTQNTAQLDISVPNTLNEFRIIGRGIFSNAGVTTMKMRFNKDTVLGAYFVTMINSNVVYHSPGNDAIVFGLSSVSNDRAFRFDAIVTNFPNSENTSVEFNTSNSKRQYL